MTSDIGLTAGLRIPADRVAPGRVLERADAAFEDLVAAHQRSVLALALRLLGDPEEAANATQDCFLRAYRALERCPAGAPGQRRWLARLVINVSMDRLRSRKWRWWRERLGLEDAPEPSVLRTPERELLAKEVSSRLALALRRLSPRQRAVFVLRHYEDYSLDEIAVHLALRVGSVKSHLSRALANLRSELREFYESGASE